MRPIRRKQEIVLKAFPQMRVLIYLSFKDRWWIFATHANLSAIAFYPLSHNQTKFGSNIKSYGKSLYTHHIRWMDVNSKHWAHWNSPPLTGIHHTLWHMAFWLWRFELSGTSARVFTSKQNGASVNMSMEVDPVVPETIQARFVSDAGEEAGPPLDLPTSVNISQLGRICNAILQNVSISTYQLLMLAMFC